MATGSRALFVHGAAGEALFEVAPRSFEAVCAQQLREWAPDTSVRAGDRGETSSCGKAASQLTVDDPGGHSRHGIGDLAITLQPLVVT